MDNPDWQVASYSILRYNQNGFFHGCGDVVVPWDVPNTAYVDGADSNSSIGDGSELDSGAATVQIVRQLKVEKRGDLVLKGKKADFLIFNSGEDELVITNIEITWPDDQPGKNGSLVEVLLGANTIWNTLADPESRTNPAISPTTIDGDPAPSGNPDTDQEDADTLWIGTEADRTIDPLEGLKIGFFFAQKVDTSGYYDITVTFEGGITDELVNITLNSPPAALLLDGTPVEDGHAPVLKDAALQHVIDKAVAYWEQHAADEADLKDIQVQIADLGGKKLAQADSGLVTIDDDAAGYGWSVGLGEVNPHKVDLLSAVIHEFGHVLGQEHGEGVMDGDLAVGERYAEIELIGSHELGASDGMLV